MTQTEKEDKVFEWIDYILNPPAEEGETPPPTIPIIWEGEPGVRPDCSYVTLKMEDVPQGTVQKGKANSIGIATARGDGKLIISTQGYGKGSDEYLNTIKENSELESVLAFLDTKDLAIWSIGTIIPIPEIIDNVPEERYEMEIILGYAWTKTDTPGYIGTVEYYGDFDK